MAGNKKEWKINSITDLKDHACSVIERLESGEIDLQYAQTCATVWAGTLSMVKTQMDYNKMLDKKDKIPFLNMGNTYDMGSTQIENKKAPALEDNSDE